VVAIVGGEEKNTLWRRSATSQHPDRLERIGDRTFVPGEIVSFLPDAIHCVEPLGDEPTITFNLYGKTDFDRRFEFDAIAHTARKF
jgi:predicted metal-dependent enzyme (double-stranded beta helix superfamily)